MDEGAQIKICPYRLSCISAGNRVIHRTHNVSYAGHLVAQLNNPGSSPGGDANQTGIL